MADLSWLGDTLGGLANIGGAIIGANAQKKTNEANLLATRETNTINKQIADDNLKFQKDKYNYEQRLQERLFGREDTSYQRTVEDMKNAGLSPLVMSGLNQAGSNVLTTTPQNSFQAIAPHFEAYDPSSSFNALGSTLSSATQHIQTSLLNREEIKQKRVDTEYKKYEKLLDLQNKILTNENLSQDKKDKELSRIEKQIDISSKKLDYLLNSETYEDRKQQIKSESKKSKSEAQVAESTVDTQINKATKEVEKAQEDIQKSAQERDIENTNYQQAKSISQQFGVPMYALRSPREFIAYYNMAVKSKTIKPTKAMKQFVRYLKKFEGQKDSERIGFSVVNAINQSGQLGVNALNSLKPVSSKSNYDYSNLPF